MTISRFPRLLAVAAVTVAIGAAGAVPATAASPADTGHLGQGGQALAGDYWTPQPLSRALSTNPWPAAATVLDRLRAHGLNPILTTGYDDPVYESNANLAGTGTSVNAVMIHDTGTSVPAAKLKTAHSLPWILSGVKSSAGKTVRACHFYVDRLGNVYVVYLRRTWHAGAGDSMFGIPANKMNGYSYGIEIESQGDRVKDLTPAQITSATKIAAAALEVAGLGVERAINHKDYAGRVQGKVDTAYDIGWWRGMIATELGVKYSPTVPSAPPVSPNPKAISMAAMRSGSSGTYVVRYQRALRKFAGSRKIKFRKINPSGVTGYYGTETRALTRAVNNKLKRSSAAWRNALRSAPASVPGTKLIRKIGMQPIS